MRGIRLHGVRDVRLDEIPVPKVGDDDVLIEIEASSLDGTDLELVQGVHRLRSSNATPVLGHEYAGVVVAKGSAVEILKVGDRVTGPWGINCGHCVYCRQGRPNLCPSQLHFGVLADGSWADFMCAPARILAPIPESLSFADAALLCCALPTAMRGVERGQIQVGDSVAVLGLGQMGLSAVLAARLKGARPIFGVDPVPERAQLARRFGATAIFDPAGQDVAAAIRELSGGLGVDRTVITVSSVARPASLPSVADTAIAVTKPGGQLVFIGLPGRAEVDLNVMQGRELTIVGSKCMLGPDFLARLLQFAATGGIDLDTYRTMVTHTIPLHELPGMLLGDELAGAVKIIITPR